MIKNIETIVENLNKDKNYLAEALASKDQQLYELKKNNTKECQNGCHRYSKSIDEICQAGSKHKEKLVALKSRATNLKKEVTSLQGEKAKLLEQVQQLEEDVMIGQNIVRKQSDEKERLYYKLIDCEKHTVAKDGVLRYSNEHNEALEKKIEFMKVKLEKTLRDYQDLEKRSRIEIDGLQKDVQNTCKN